MSFKTRHVSPPVNERHDVVETAFAGRGQRNVAATNDEGEGKYRLAAPPLPLTIRRRNTGQTVNFPKRCSATSELLLKAMHRPAPQLHGCTSTSWQAAAAAETRRTRAYTCS